MSFQKNIALGLAIVSILLVGCTSQRFGSPYQTSSAPINAAPRGQISQSQLPPPGENYGYPQQNNPVADSQMAALEAPSNALELSASSIAGVWRASVDGMPCQIATPMTKFGQGYRAGPMRCPVALAGVNSWNIEGTRLMFYNREGAVVAQLSSSNGTGFSGRTSSGSALTLSR